MHILVTDTTGQTHEGVVLAAGQNTMRVAIRNQNDAMELRLCYGVWTSNDDQIFEIGGLTADTDAAMSSLGEAFKSQTMTAGMRS